MKSTLRILGLLAVLAIAAPGFVSAADKTDAKPKAEGKAKGKYTPLYAQVDSITDTLLTVKGAGPELKFVINAETKISKDKAHKETATVADVKPGQWVGGSYTKGTDGTNVLHSLHLGVNQKGEKPEKKPMTSLSSRSHGVS
jgi:hypothetical protein